MACARRPDTKQADVAPALSIDLALALTRLDHSRAGLRAALKPAAPSKSDSGDAFFHPLRSVRAWLRATAWGAPLEPVLNALSQELKLWWERQSWRQAVLQAKDVVSAEVSPWVRRYPIAAVLVTATAGALVISSGVWRWHTLRRSAWVLAAQLRRACIGQLSNPAVQGVLLSTLVSYLASRTQPGSTDQPQRREAADSNRV